MTVHVAGACASTSCTTAGSTATGTATSATSASTSEAASDGAGSDCASLDGDVERRRILVPARDVGMPAAPRRERRGSADEAGADDREPHGVRPFA